MTLEEIIERLTEIMEENDAADWEIRGAFQPSYPLMGWLEEVAYSEKDKTIFFAIGSGTEYGKRAMWDGGNIDDDEEEEDDED